VSDEERWLFWEAENGYYRAHLRVTGPDDGGRRQPILTGYRAAWAISAEEDREHIVHDAPLLIEGQQQIAPGGEGTVRLHPLYPEYWADVTAGTPLLMKEGHRTVGTATVLERVAPEKG
jgi:translation elongation factor EF-Tu-like GTPase